MYLNQCILYAAGLYQTFAFDDLSFNALASQLPAFPSLKNDHQYDANNAIDRKRDTCMRTDAIGTGASATYHFMWWKVDLGGIYNIYSIDILFKDYTSSNVEENRQRGRFAGFSLYVSNTGNIEGSTLCYKDGSELPPLNFTATCTEYGQYVIFYNERKDGVVYPDGYQLTNVYTELCEVIVRGCKKHGVYGNACDIACPVACKKNICHIQHGTCLECEPGLYGSYCTLICPTTCNDNTCDRQNGTCLTCKPGWTGIYCKTKCTNGWYGVDCSHQCSEHCRANTPCNHMTGQCDGGCDKGWTGPLCNKECENGTYGYNCTNKCSGHCLNDSPCNKQTGHCDNGCYPGYTNRNCSKECEQNKFGMDCKEQCSGHCNNSEPCDRVSGVCFGGCQDGYLGAQCFNSCTAGYYGKNCNVHCSMNCNGSCEQDGSCYDCEEILKRYCFKETGTTSIELPQKLSTNLPVTVGGIVGSLVVLSVGVVFYIFILRLKRKATTMDKRVSMMLEVRPNMTIKSRHSVDQKLPDNKVNDNAISTYALPEKTKRGPPTNKNIPVRNIMAHISNMSSKENAGFKSEYHDIPRGELHPCTEAKKSENKAKNRYTTIYPYDHSRIILKTVALDGSGYINANYIEDTQGRRLYIATQGPKPKTIADFWTMIWQEEVCNIVCLTNLTEGTKNKCAQYWPDINDKLQGGTLTVRHLEEKNYAEYIIRRFRLHNKTTRTDRRVTMFHYTTWSDHGVADPLSLVVFHRQVIKATANSAGKYTVVHCSAGVGRTGTYIAVDALYRKGEKTGKINVPMYVRTMRKDRMNMIQGDDQYKLLYLALKDAFYGQNKCLETEKFLGEYQEQTRYTNCGDLSQKNFLSSDLEELLSLRKEYTQQDYISGRAQISANYTESVLPVEEFMCHLYYMKGYNTYYNAVLIQSYLEKDSLISAQYPLPDNTDDFLRLIKDFDARIVVFLCPIEDIESSSKWFPPENQHKFNGIFYVKNMSSTRSHNVKLTRLNIQPTGFNEMDITLLECPTWGERMKRGDKRVLLDVVKSVKTEKSNNKGRVLVLSSDGATRCGPFFVVYNVLEQISVDREVDIFTAVRQIQIRRPECVSTVDEYKLCHDAVAEYLLNDCVYGNC